MKPNDLPIDLPTPYYYYDMELLERTLEVVKTESSKYGFHVHYAIKANANPHLLECISHYGLGADCVSGNEIQRALSCHFPAWEIVYAGVGKKLSWLCKKIYSVLTANL